MSCSIKPALNGRHGVAQERGNVPLIHAAVPDKLEYLPLIRRKTLNGLVKLGPQLKGFGLVGGIGNVWYCSTKPGCPFPDIRCMFSSGPLGAKVMP